MEFFWTCVYGLAFDVMLFVKYQNRNATHYTTHTNSNLLELRFHLLWVMEYPQIFLFLLNILQD